MTTEALTAMMACSAPSQPISALQAASSRITRAVAKVNHTAHCRRALQTGAQDRGAVYLCGRAATQKGGAERPGKRSSREVMCAESGGVAELRRDVCAATTGGALARAPMGATRGSCR